MEGVSNAEDELCSRVGTRVLDRFEQNFWRNLVCDEAKKQILGDM